MLEVKIKELKQDIIEFATLVENMLEKSVRGLLKKDAHILHEVLDVDESHANAFDILIDEKCINTVAQFQPRARDLRTILMILKMGSDLERLGDGAVNICKSALFLIERPPVKPLIDLPRLAEAAIAMLKDSILAFINEDGISAKEICARDSYVDELRDRIIAELTQIMIRDATTVERALELMDITRKLERAADLSTNVCEDVIFMVQGKVIKHHKDE